MFGHKWLTPDEEMRYARELAEKFAPFSPSCVVYLERGGQRVGEVVAARFGIPSSGIDLSYPLSPGINQAPKFARLLLWPMKEVAYRLSRPTLRREPQVLKSAERLALVDDSASTGRSIAAALCAMERLGLKRHQICVGVIRCGRRAREYVDHYLIAEPVSFIRY